MPTISDTSARARPRPRYFGVDQHADAANVPLPAAKLLMQRGVADDLAVHRSQQRQVAAQVNVLAPVANDLRFRRRGA